eukprot:CAMPEP_0113609994 /NCGR_PEP_ID=MMETSP0017_2-20120614/4784_1 /TAXON_ID=2856 /ORGANISM="Cylindrotheca closterium" /LENGTH=265 /DNA_ID=CAMNT_0000518841 /DNA_START=90 /DNA_END=887 /DNA_ORIENTATION=- /assembly_acc=CAM_ASM_000147
MTEQEQQPAKDFYLFLDCDDTLYRDDWKVAVALTKKINDYTTNVLKLPDGKAYELYKKYGTCLRGLQVEGLGVGQPDFDTEAMLFQIHDQLPISESIPPNPDLKSMLKRIDLERVSPCVFTASIQEHATRCMQALGIYDSFIVKNQFPIIDVRSVNFYTKHDVEALEFAQKIVKCPVDCSSRCILVDDSQTNIRVAKQAGWQTVLVGHKTRDGKSQLDFEYADHVIDKVTELEEILPHLFVMSNKGSDDDEDEEEKKEEEEEPNN